MINTQKMPKNLSNTRVIANGARSFGPVRASIYGSNDYPDYANDMIVRFAMIETAEALDNLDAIWELKGWMLFTSDRLISPCHWGVSQPLMKSIHLRPRQSTTF